MATSASKEDPQVTYCRGCSMMRLTHSYRGLRICERCWRKRKAIHATDLAVRKHKEIAR